MKPNNKLKCNPFCDHSMRLVVGHILEHFIAYIEHLQN